MVLSISGLACARSLLYCVRLSFPFSQSHTFDPTSLCTDSVPPPLLPPLSGIMSAHYHFPPPLLTMQTIGQQMPMAWLSDGRWKLAPPMWKLAPKSGKVGEVSGATEYWTPVPRTRVPYITHPIVRTIGRSVLSHI